MKTAQQRPALAVGAVLLGMAVAAGYDLSTQQVCYVIPGAHLDTQWEWTLGTTITEFIPNTLHTNFPLIAQYPEYKFNFEGAYRYWIVKQYGGAKPGAGYNANDWTTLKNYVQQGKWITNGGLWSPCDVNIPSAEALVRQILYNQQFFQDEFGTRSNDVYLPDCFGFGYALPTIEAHCGLKGFSTQKLSWGGWIPEPFPIGRWIGVDGSSVVACLKPGEYVNGLDIVTEDGDYLRSHTTSFTNGPGGQPGIWATYDYMGTGDQGGGPSSGDVSAMITRQRANASNAIKVYTSSSGQIFDDLTPAMVSALPTYDGELVMSTHGVGCYTSWSPMKFRNRRNEQRAALTEFACVSAASLTGGGFAYPQDTIRHAWYRVLNHQFHDDLTGTSIPEAYSQFSIPGEDSSYNDFNYALGLATTAMANSAGQVLSTTASAQDGRVPLVVVNSVGFGRTDVVEATVNFGTAVPAGVKVYTEAGTETPAQILSTSGQNVTIAFVATVPSASFSVYEAKPVTAANAPDPALTIDASTRITENAYYRVTVNQNGDISSIVAKTVRTGQELLSAPSRLELRAEQGGEYPAWEIQYASCSATPTYVGGTPTITVAENGPARVSLKVTRTSGSSQFTQYIRLGAGDAGKRVDVYNEINWLTTNTLLKAGFPVTSSNPNATWDLGIGTIQRPNMTTARYEVPGQQWADMTSTDGTYGMSILNNCKYGWNKESNSKLNLTLIHSPVGTAGNGDDNYERDQSSVAIVGIHKFTYSLYGHAGDWTSGTVQQGECLNQPVYAFQAQPRAGTKTVRSFSFLSLDTAQVDVMAIKKAEKSGNSIVRVRETMGKALASAKLTFAQTIVSAVEVTGAEDTLIGAVAPQISGNTLTFSLTKYKPRAFSVNLGGMVGGVRKPGGRDQLKNPSRKVTLHLSTTRSAVATLLVPADQIVRSVLISDAAGRVVRNLTTPGNVDQGPLVWDGKDAEMRSVRAGVYYVNCLTDRSQASAATAVVRR